MFKQPTYEEYLKASNFARFKYKWGLVVQLIAIICFIFVIFYMVHYGKELAMNPLIYAAEKTGTECICTQVESGKTFYVNSTSMYFKVNNPYAINLDEE